MSTPKYKLKSFDPGKVKITGGFWKRHLDSVTGSALLDVFNRLRDTGRLDLLTLKWKRSRPDKPQPCWDSDVAMWLTGACCSLKRRKSPKIEALVEKVANLLVRAQQADGYINSYITTLAPKKRWKNLSDGYELHFAGCLFEAAVAHFELTGKKKLLRVAERFANHIAAVFAPGNKKQLPAFPGRDTLVSALIELTRVTQKQKYADFAAAFINRSGDLQQFSFGAVDVATCKADAQLFTICKATWKDLALRKMYITGGVTEAPYQLPNDSQGVETSSAIDLIRFARRMFHVDPDSKYTDVIERTLYNSVLAASSQRGLKYFDANPLESSGKRRRTKCFSDACCAPDILRFMNSFGEHVFSAARRGPLYVNLYAHCAGTTSIGGVDVTLRMRTDYPWDAAVSISILPDDPLTFSLMLRIPSWCGKFTVSVNDKPINNPPRKKGYAQIRRRWEKGDTVELLLEMPVERMVAHPRVGTNVGKIAIQRGPLVYCIEQCDHSPDVRSVTIGDNASLTAKPDKRLFGGIVGIVGIVVVEGKAFAASKAGWGGKLYRPSEQTCSRGVKLKAIPYYLWGNRTGGAMVVWIPEA